MNTTKKKDNLTTATDYKREFLIKVFHKILSANLLSYLPFFNLLLHP